jgi:hypothetical protein
MEWFEFFLIALATFRLTRLLVYDRITAPLRAPFHEVREEMEADGSTYEVLYVKGSGVQKFFGELLSCHWCTGVWSAAILYAGNFLFPIVFHPILYILAIAAVGSLIEEMIVK